MLSMKPLVQEWASAIEAAKKAKTGFNETHRICRQFFTGAIGQNSMFGDEFRRQYLGDIGAPRFQLTINKVFELTSIVGPTLLWNNPGRHITNHERLEIPPEFWGAPGDPQAQQVGMQWLQEYEQEQAQSETRNALMQSYLNYSCREQPGGGLKTDCHFAILDALVSGRGVIRVDAYQPADSKDTLTGGFYVSVDDLFIDPDCRRGNLSDAKWIAIRHTAPHWEVEKRFGWPEGSLKNKSKQASMKATTDAVQSYREGNPKRTDDLNDLITYYEVFSKMGVGTRFKNKRLPEWHQAFESSVGDWAYCCFADNCDEFLNVRTQYIENGSLEQVKMAFDWPIPYYKDGRWPVSLLDFWHVPGSCWPMATIAAGLGELVFLNVFVSSLCDRVYQDSLCKWAIREDLVDDAKSKLTSFSHEVIGLNPASAASIKELVSFLERPPVTFDAFRMLDQVSTMFDKRVGLTELMYGLNPGGKVSRTAADANQKGEAISVRPEYMSTQVEAWQTEIANLERIAAGYSVSGQTLVPLFGNMGSRLWDQLITSADPNVYMREMRSRVEANSIRKPNKARFMQNMQNMSAFLLPVLQWYAGSTGDTTPLNNLIKSIGNSMDQDTSDWEMQSLKQKAPSEEEIQAMQQEQQFRQEEQEIKSAQERATLTGKEMQNRKMAQELFEMGVGEDISILDTIEPDPEVMFESPVQE